MEVLPNGIYTRGCDAYLRFLDVHCSITSSIVNLGLLVQNSRSLGHNSMLLSFTTTVQRGEAGSTVLVLAFFTHVRGGSLLASGPVNIADKL
jgi:hypothetical protein